MIEKKIFILDLENERGHAGAIRGTCEDLDLKTKISVANRGSLKSEIPKDQDFYFLHLSEVDEEDVKRLKEKQPYSYFVAISGGAGNFPQTLKDLFNEEMYIFLSSDYERILKSSWDKSP